MYLAKFLIEKSVDKLSINGGFMPLNSIKLDQISLLDLNN
jgi:hypothetical protein